METGALFHTALVVLFVRLDFSSSSSDSAFYSFSAKFARGFEAPPPSSSSRPRLLHFSSLRGKAVLAANVACLCGHTDADYRALVALHRRLASSGRFEVLAFPCNQFGAQEPWEEERIVQHVRYTYGVQFPILEKVDVRGPDVHPVWKFFQDQTGTTPTWNFFKHLVNHRGDVVATFPPGANWSTVEREVEKAVAAAAKDDAAAAREEEKSEL